VTASHDGAVKLDSWVTGVRPGPKSKPVADPDHEADIISIIRSVQAVPGTPPTSCYVCEWCSVTAAVAREDITTGIEAHAETAWFSDL
jgi:hypothetical protein